MLRSTFLRLLDEGVIASERLWPTITPSPNPIPKATKIDEAGYSWTNSVGADVHSSNVELPP